MSAFSFLTRSFSRDVLPPALLGSSRHPRLGHSMESGSPPTQAWLLHLLGQPSAISLSVVDIQG